MQLNPENVVMTHNTQPTYVGVSPTLHTKPHNKPEERDKTAAVSPVGKGAAGEVLSPPQQDYCPTKMILIYEVYHNAWYEVFILTILS